MGTRDQMSNWAGSISEWWNHSQDLSGDSLYTVLLTGASGNDDGGREIVPGPAAPNTPSAQPKFQLLRLSALNINSITEEGEDEDADALCELTLE